MHERTTGLTTGIVGLTIMRGASAPLAGSMAGRIVTGGVMPVTALGMLGAAGKPYKTKEKRR